MSVVQKTLLVTGATGFLGSHLVKHLVALGHKVAVLLRETSNTQRLTSVLHQLRCYVLRSSYLYADLSRPFVELGSIDAVIHCATHYGRDNEVGAVFESNTVLPVKLLELTNAAKVVNFINTDTVLAPNLNAYALSKYQFKEWGRYAANTWKMRFVNLRFEHFYGAGDDEAKFTSHVVQACLANQETLALTAGEQLRDFIYIDDAVAAYMTVLNQLATIPIDFVEYDVGTGQVASIRQFAELVQRLTGSRTRLDFGARLYRPNEMMCSCADTSALRLLGWDCQYRLEEGLFKMIESMVCNSRS